MVAKRCQYPVGADAWTVDCCERPAAWETDDLQEIHYLCETHCSEALRWNDFLTEEVSK